MLVADEFQTHNLDAKYCTTFLGRLIPRHHIDIKMVQRWLMICRESHSKDNGPCGSSSPLAGTSTPDVQIRLIDLHEGRLISTPLRDKEYATLSYVWGLNQNFKLYRSNLQSLSTPGALDPCDETFSAPQTVQDTMILTKSLGIRYVWIDALCIIQGDLADWLYMAPLMERIYGHSVINICAAAGTDCDYGLPGTVLTARHAIQPVVNLADMKLMVMKSVEGLIQSSVWNTRAWTFQERLMSKRCLVFIEDRVVFQCRQSTWSEDVDSESKIKTWTLDCTQSPFKSFHNNPLRLFVECVELYSGRALTCKGDRLHAFAGIQSLLSVSLHTEFLRGLPIAQFDFALLWDYAAPCTQMVREADVEPSEFPSWSWAGWLGKTTWRTSMLSGCLLSLNDWLDEHTWVVYYTLLDSEVAPIWAANAKSLESDDPITSESPQSNGWQGYELGSVGSWGRTYLFDASLSDKPCKPTVTSLVPNRLYFWTYTAFFKLSPERSVSADFAAALSPGLYRFGILDRSGEWCGTIVLHESWLGEEHIERVHEFAAISEARDFAMDELDLWEYYIPEERDEAEWYVYFALLIIWDEEHTVAERLGVAKIFQKAFDSGSYEPNKAWREIALK